MKETIIKIHVSMEANLKYLWSLFSNTLSRFRFFEFYSMDHGLKDTLPLRIVKKDIVII